MREDKIWYRLGHISKNPMARFMSNISKKCNLSRVYTNHCITVTGATILTRMKFSASEVMSVTGHTNTRKVMTRGSDKWVKSLAKL